MEPLPFHLHCWGCESIGFLEGAAIGKQKPRQYRQPTETSSPESSRQCPEAPGGIMLHLWVPNGHLSTRGIVLGSPVNAKLGVVDIRDRHWPHRKA